MDAPDVRDTHSGPAVQSLERGLRLLGAFRERPSLSLSELAGRLPVHRTSTLRLVHTLERNGYLARDGAGRYRLGPALYELGGLALARLDVRAAARPVLEALAAETGETVQLVVRDGRDILVVDGIESAHRVKVGAGRGERRPLHATASGKCFLAALPEPDVARLLGDLPLTALTPRTLVSAAALLAELRTVRAQGYAVNLGESEAGARFVAAPVGAPGAGARRGEAGDQGEQQQPVAALAVGAPADRLPRHRLQRLGRRLRAAAWGLSGASGAPGTPPPDGPQPA